MGGDAHLGQEIDSLVSKRAFYARDENNRDVMMVDDGGGRWGVDALVSTQGDTISSSAPSGDPTGVGVSHERGTPVGGSAARGRSRSRGARHPALLDLIWAHQFGEPRSQRFVKS